MNKFEAAFLGVTGSCPYNSGKRKKYGSNTLCVAVRAGDETFIFDTGSGVCGFGSLDEYQNDHVRIFYSHSHLDHMCSLLFFPYLFNPEKKLSFYGSGRDKTDLKSVIRDIFSSELSPVGLDEFKAVMDFNTISSGDIIELQSGVTVRVYGLSHPGGALGYRVEYDGKAYCHLTDIELADHKDDAGLLEFMHGADLLIMDSFFDDGGIIPGWGHSSWLEAAEWAKRADAKKLGLFHYSYLFTDEDIDLIEQQAKKVFPGAFATADFMRIEI